VYYIVTPPVFITSFTSLSYRFCLIRGHCATVGFYHDRFEGAADVMKLKADMWADEVMIRWCEAYVKPGDIWPIIGHNRDYRFLW